jgi:hypothetical protein
MKRSIFIAVLGLGSAVAAFGQGKIAFSNYFSHSSPKVTFASNGLGVGAEVNAELAFYVGTSATDVPTSLSQMTLGAASIVPFGIAGGDTDGSAYAGWFQGSTFTVPGISAANASFVSFDVLAFEGGSYAAATMKGASIIFQSPVSAASNSGTPNLVQGPWQSFTVAAVPEPTTLALAGLGGLASLVALRRKKA